MSSPENFTKQPQDNDDNPENRLEALKKKLLVILQFRIDVENIEDIDFYLDDIFDQVVAIIEEARKIYGKQHPEIEDIQEIEDAALNSFGLGNVPGVLDKISEIKDLLKNKIPGIVSRDIPEVITPPDKKRGRF